MRSALLVLPLLQLTPGQRDALLQRGVRGLIEHFVLERHEKKKNELGVKESVNAAEVCLDQHLARLELEGGYCASRYLLVRVNGDLIRTKVPHHVRMSLP